MKGQIRTVTGDIEPAGLGFTQSHEHILLRKGTSWEVSPVLWQDEPEKSEQELMDYRRAGGCSLVDAQPVGCSRMAEEMERISRSSGVHIIASTGFHKLIFYPGDHWIHTMPQAELAQLYISELTGGMFEDGDESRPVKRTSCRAGQIKTALDVCGLTEEYRRLFAAAAAASGETGAPIMIHIENGADPCQVLAFLKAEGIEPGRMLFCHLDRACADLAIHAQIAEAGAYLEYDTIGRFKYHSDEEEIRILREMVSLGYEDRILVSLDTTRARLAHYGGEIGLTYLIDNFLPGLCKAEAGRERQVLTGTAVHKFTGENPANAFAWRG